MFDAEPTILEGTWQAPVPRPEENFLSPVLEAAPLEEVHWQPMLTLFGAEIAAQFTWAVTTDTVETYEHRETLRYLHIDSVTGECLNQNCEVISQESALQYAFQSAVKVPAQVVPTQAEEIIAMDAVEPTGAPDPAVQNPDCFKEANTKLEPDIAAFTRKMDLVETSEEKAPLSGGVFQLGVFRSLNKLLTQTQQLGKIAHWSDPLTSKLQEAGGGHAQSHEPAFSNFTRRTG